MFMRASVYREQKIIPFINKLKDFIRRLLRNIGFLEAELKRTESKLATAEATTDYFQEKLVKSEMLAYAQERELRYFKEELGEETVNVIVTRGEARDREWEIERKSRHRSHDISR